VIKVRVVCGVLSVALCVSVADRASAYVTAYQCVVKESKMLADSGVLENWDYGLDAEFVVDKGTGRMNGKLKNHGFFGEPTIIDPGSNEQAFKVVTIHDAGFPAVDYLYIKVFEEGWPKPFMYRTGSEIYSGTCVPY
jgi:hypothetical protein